MRSPFATLPPPSGTLPAARLQRLARYTGRAVVYGTLAIAPADANTLSPPSVIDFTGGRKIVTSPEGADTRSSPVANWSVFSNYESAMSRRTDHDILAAEAENYLGQVYGLLATGKKDEATDLVYDRFHDLLTEGDYEKCSAILLAAEPAKLGSSVSRSMLSLTLRCKKYLWGRANFYRSAFAHIVTTQDEGRANRLLGHLA